MILGTAAYMSPEQARGRAVDQRADIWAFGAILFEMLSGKPPFAGETVTDILARVMERDPDWSALAGVDSRQRDARAAPLSREGSRAPAAARGRCAARA